jgi:hypothetical protein
MPGALGLALVLGGTLLCLAILGGVRMPWESTGGIQTGNAAILQHAGIWPPTSVTAATG